MSHYLLCIWGDVEPEIFGPFDTTAERDADARLHRSEHGDENGLYMLDVSETGVPTVSAYSGEFFDGSAGT